MKTPINEIIDRYSILLLKQERTDLNIKKEIGKYYKEIQKYDKEITHEFVSKMRRINGQIWDLESMIRQEKEAELGLEEVGRRAIAIRQLNKVRITIKNEISLHFKEGFIEQKIEHGSAD